MEAKQLRALEKSIAQLRDLQSKKEHLLSVLTDRLDKEAFGKNWQEFFNPLIESEPDMYFVNHPKEVPSGSIKRWLIDPSTSFQIVVFHGKDGKITSAFAEEYDDGEWQPLDYP
jgi:hypothetical protein